MFLNRKLQNEQIIAIKKKFFQLNMLSIYKKYLGLSSMIGRKKMSFFNNMKLKFLSKF